MTDTFVVFGLLLKNGSLSTLEFLVQMIRSCRLMLLMTNDALISYGFTLQNLIQFILLAYFYGMVHFFRLNYLSKLIHSSFLNYFTFLILLVECENTPLVRNNLCVSYHAFIRKFFNQRMKRTMVGFTFFVNNSQLFFLVRDKHFQAFQSTPFSVEVV